MTVGESNWAQAAGTVRVQVAMGGCIRLWTASKPKTGPGALVLWCRIEGTEGTERRTELIAAWVAYRSYMIL